VRDSHFLFDSIFLTDDVIQFRLIEQSNRDNVNLLVACCTQKATRTDIIPSQFLTNGIKSIQLCDETNSTINTLKVATFLEFYERSPEGPSHDHPKH